MKMFTSAIVHSFSTSSLRYFDDWFSSFSSIAGTTAGQPGSAGKHDDMTRGDKIRKSLRKMMTVKNTKRKNSKMNLSQDSTSKASTPGQVYYA